MKKKLTDLFVIIFADIRAKRQKEIEKSFYGACAMGNLDEARKIGHLLSPPDKRKIVTQIPEKGISLLYK